MALPALGNFGGGLLAEVVPLSNRVLSLSVHAAVGVIIGVVSVELVPTALNTEASWVVILAFLGGGVVFMLLDRSIEYVQSRFSRTNGSATPWMNFAAVCIDLFSDGVMIGTGSTMYFVSHAHEDRTTATGFVGLAGTDETFFASERRSVRRTVSFHLFRVLLGVVFDIASTP